MRLAGAPIDAGEFTVPEDARYAKPTRRRICHPQVRLVAGLAVAALAVVTLLVCSSGGHRKTGGRQPPPPRGSPPAAAIPGSMAHTGPMTQRSACPTDRPCCATDCGAHSAPVGGNGEPCGCGRCTDGYGGEACTLAPAYVISGGTERKYSGRYERLTSQCNGKPVYRGPGYVLYQPENATDWVVDQAASTPKDGEPAQGTACSQASRRAAITSATGGGSCTLSPDGSGCAARWWEFTGSRWQSTPSLMVSTCSVDDPCCGISCDTHGTMVGDGVSKRCGCHCTDGYSGNFCQLSPSYIVSGATDSTFNGRYDRITTAAAGRHSELVVECSGQPIYQRGGSDGPSLYQPLHGTFWMIGPPARTADCGLTGFLKSSSGSGGMCAPTTSAEDNAPCAGSTWQETRAGAFISAPSVAVTTCSPMEPCCGLECGAHGYSVRTDAGSQHGTAAGQCGCSCTADYVGAFCQHPPAYILGGATLPLLNGRYSRLSYPAVTCNGQPTFQLCGGDGLVLFQPSGQASGQPSSWMVGDSTQLSSCTQSGYLQTTGVCSMSPGLCQGSWKEAVGTEWLAAPSLTVRVCKDDSPCCGIDCGSHGSPDTNTGRNATETHDDISSSTSSNTSANANANASSSKGGADTHLLAELEQCECSCRDDYLGAFCDLAPAYVVSGATAQLYNGRFTPMKGEDDDGSSGGGAGSGAMSCNGKPVYSNSRRSYVLYQPSGFSVWVIAPHDRSTSAAAAVAAAAAAGGLSPASSSFSCAATGVIMSSGSCAAAPDGRGCAGRWQEPTNDCGGEHLAGWCVIDTIAVVAAPATPQGGGAGGAGGGK